jgi:hypothetical protein
MFSRLQRTSQSTAESRLEAYSAEVNLATKAGSRSHNKWLHRQSAFLESPPARSTTDVFYGHFQNGCDINKNLRVVGAAMRASNSGDD